MTPAGNKPPYILGGIIMLVQNLEAITSWVEKFVFEQTYIHCSYIGIFIENHQKATCVICKLVTFFLEHYTKLLFKLVLITHSAMNI